MRKQTSEEMQITFKAARNAFCVIQAALIIWIVVTLIATGELMAIPCIIFFIGSSVFFFSTSLLRKKDKK